MPKVVINNIIPFPGYKAINLFGIIFARSKMSKVDLNHEAIHTAQMKELGYILFYILYLLDYLIISIRNPKLSLNKRYHMIKFEIEAYNNQDNLEYLKTRKHYAWKS